MSDSDFEELKPVDVLAFKQLLQGIPLQMPIPTDEEIEYINRNVQQKVSEFGGIGLTHELAFFTDHYLLPWQRDMRKIRDLLGANFNNFYKDENLRQLLDEMKEKIWIVVFTSVIRLIYPEFREEETLSLERFVEEIEKIFSIKLKEASQYPENINDTGMPFKEALNKMISKSLRGLPHIKSFENGNVYMLSNLSKGLFFGVAEILLIMQNMSKKPELLKELMNNNVGFINNTPTVDLNDKNKKFGIFSATPSLLNKFNEFVSEEKEGQIYVVLDDTTTSGKSLSNLMSNFRNELFINALKSGLQKDQAVIKVNKFLTKIMFSVNQIDIWEYVQDPNVHKWFRKSDDTRSGITIEIDKLK